MRICTLFIYRLRSVPHLRIKWTSDSVIFFQLYEMRLEYRRYLIDNYGNLCTYIIASSLTGTIKNQSATLDCFV